jgi:hypothetical protein
MMRRPIFNKFSSCHPQEDYNERMRVYLLHLEERNTLCYRLENEVGRLRLEAHKAEQEARSLRQSMKVLRSQLKAMFKE